MNNPLCQICQRREVDCERFYRETVEQCADFLEFDPNEPVLPTQVTPTEWVLSGTIPTASPTITDEDTVEQLVDAPAPVEKGPTRRQVITKWLVVTLLVFLAMMVYIYLKTKVLHL